LLADDLKKRGFRGTIAFPPGFIDGRTFQWRGFNVGIRYSFLAFLPPCETYVDKRVSNRVRKAINLGYSASRSNNWEAIQSCLEKTEEFKEFSHLTSPEDFTCLYTLLGEDGFRGYLCIDKSGKPVSSRVWLISKEGLSIAWSAGTTREHIKNGVNQLLFQKCIDDIEESGCSFLDLCGANIKPVANAKAAWGFPLVPYITISNDTMPRKLYRYFVPKKLKPLVRSLFKGV